MIKWSPDVFVIILALQRTRLTYTACMFDPRKFVQTLKVGGCEVFPLPCMHLFWIHPEEPQLGAAEG